MEIEKEIYELQSDIRVINEKMIALLNSINDYRILNERALSKAENDMNRRLEGMNEFRAQLKDQTTTFATVEMHNSLKESNDIFQKQITEKTSAFVTRDMLDQMEKGYNLGLTQLLEKIENRINSNQAALDMKSNLNIDSIKKLENAAANTEGRRYTQQMVWGVIVIIIAAVVSYTVNHLFK